MRKTLVWAEILIASFLLIYNKELSAQISKKDFSEVEKLVKGILYLRINAPFRFRKIGLRLQLETLTQVSPSGSNVDLSRSEMPDLNTEGVLWWFLPNDPVRYGMVHPIEDSLEVAFEDLPPRQQEVTIRFVAINTFDDFKAAFDRTFAHITFDSTIFDKV